MGRECAFVQKGWLKCFQALWESAANCMWKGLDSQKSLGTNCSCLKAQILLHTWSANSPNTFPTYCELEKKTSPQHLFFHYEYHLDELWNFLGWMCSKIVQGNERNLTFMESNREKSSGVLYLLQKRSHQQKWNTLEEVLKGYKCFFMFINWQLLQGGIDLQLLMSMRASAHKKYWWTALQPALNIAFGDTSEWASG